MERKENTQECPVIVKTFSLYKKNHPHKYYKLNNIESKDLFFLLQNDFAKFMDDYKIDNSKLNKPNQTCSLYRPRPTHIDPKPKTRFSIFSENRILCGQISLGDVDVFKEIRDVKRKTSRYTEPNESVQDPFFFLIYLPTNSDKGCIIIEDCVKGASTLLTRKILKAFVNANFDESIRIKISDFLQDDFIKMLVTEGVVQKVTMSYNTIPAEVCERMGILINANDEFEFQIVLKAKEKTTLGENVKKKVLSVLDEGYHSFFEGTGETWWYNEDADVRVRAGIEETKKTIPLRNPFEYKPTYKIIVHLDNNFRTDYEDMKSGIFKFIQKNINPLFNVPKENTN